MKIGYARVSTREQDPDRQIAKFKEIGIDDRFIFVDYASGKNFERPKYQMMRCMIREGDVVYIDALDRLGRTYDGIVDEWKYITRELKADIVCLDNEALFDSGKFRTMGDFGKVIEDQFLSLLAYVAEQERLKNRQRQIEGIKVARTKGVRFGRPKIEITDRFATVYQSWKQGESTAVAAMKQLDMSRRTFYRRVKEYEKKIERGV